MTVAGEGQVPVGKLLGRQGPKPSKWRAVTRWRDWSLPVKLGAVTLVPIVIALVLGGVTFSSQLEESDRYDRVDRLAQLSTAASTLLDGVQRERTRTVAALTEGTGADSQELRGIRADVDKAVQPVKSALGDATGLDAGLTGPAGQLDEQLGKLAGLRDDVRSGQLGPVDALTGYSAITTALLNVDTALVAGIGDDAIGGTPNALHNLLVAKEEVSVQQALIGYGIGRGGLAPSEFNQLRTSSVRLTDRVSEFGTAATAAQQQDFDATVRGDGFDERNRVVRDVLAGQDSGNSNSFGSLNAQEWTDTSAAVFTSLGQVSDRLSDQIATTASELAGSAGTSVGVFAIVLLLALALAVLVVFVITRQLLRSLKMLRRSALEVADKELPDAVRHIQEGRSQSTDITPVAVHTDDEVGEVARAFDAVHAQALRLAAEQAGMRTGYASVFVNLSRRSQSLVQRQLQLIERLERDEEDADQLATLFQLDHLATRMRRNNENLMVLSGAEPGRRSGQPVGATDVLRAAVSEIEQYQRVVVRTPPPVRVVGYAAGDLVRLVAELLDNAAAFSAPETQVTVATRLMEDGSLSVDIMDKGIGMNEAEVAEANARLTEAGSVDLATSRRMGLFVVGRLAGRHGFGVSLHGGKDIVGVRATVTVPAELVMGQQQSPQQQPPQLAQPQQNHQRQQYPNQQHQSQQAQRPQQQPSGLPQRREPQQNQSQQGPGGLPRRKVNGSSRSGMLPNFTAGAPQIPPPSDNEISGTALFTPIGRDDQQQAPPPSASPPPPAAREAVPEQSERTAKSEQPEQHGQQPEQPAEAAAPAPREGTTPPVAEEAEATESIAPPPRQGEPRPAEAKAEQPENDPLSGKDLFAATSTAVSDWWSAATTASDAERRARLDAQSTTETTPIFDEMLSAWFRSVTEPTAAKTGAAKNEWDFAADERWRTVQAVSQRQTPADYTPAGLPRRRKGERLLPGSAVPAERQESENSTAAAAQQDRQRPARDAVDMRGRLSSFQQGVSRGRRHRKAEAAAPGTEPEQQQPGQSQQPQQSQQSQQPQQRTRNNQASGLPQRQPRKKQASAQETPETESPADAGTSAGDSSGATAPASEWAFAADERRRTVQTVSDSAPSTYTAAGLPRRRRGEQLLPGSATSSAAERRPRTERDPDDVRGRLNSFQQGIRRGRHRTAQATESSQQKVEGE